MGALTGFVAEVSSMLSKGRVEVLVNFMGNVARAKMQATKFNGLRRRNERASKFALMWRRLVFAFIKSLRLELLMRPIHRDESFAVCVSAPLIALFYRYKLFWL
jgi:hypothetical protein